MSPTAQASVRSSSVPASLTPITKRIHKDRAAGVLTAVLAVFVTLVVVGCGSGAARNVATPGPTTPRAAAPTTSAPTLTYPGRLLLSPADGGLYGLASGAEYPDLIASGVDAAADATTASPSGALFVDLTNGTLIAVSTHKVVHLPDAVNGLDSASFSPDGKRLAYTTGSGKLIVYDLAAKTSHIVLQTPCADYNTLTGEQTICGVAGNVVWIDPTTLFVAHFTGQMPETIPSPCDPSGCTDDPNTYSILTAAGQTVMNVALRPPEEPAVVLGNTVLFGDGWVDISKLRTGAATLHPLPHGWETGSLSPDGTLVAVPGGPTWKLYNIRTGAVRVLGTPDPPAPNQFGTGWVGDSNSDPFFWSPDGHFFAVQTDGIYVVPVSSAKGIVVSPSFDQYPVYPSDQSPQTPNLMGWAP